MVDKGGIPLSTHPQALNDRQRTQYRPRTIHTVALHIGWHMHHQPALLAHHKRFSTY